jgi:flagellar motor switch protein FliM
LREGDVIKLDQETDEEILMLVGNQPKFKGKPALKGKKLVFSISRLVED